MLKVSEVSADFAGTDSNKSEELGVHRLMPQVIKPQTVTTMTRDGELVIKMVIELNLNLNGQVSSVVASTDEVAVAQSTAFKKEDTAEWMVPDFGPSTEKIEFGKYEK